MRHLIILLTSLASLFLVGVGWSETDEWSDDSVWVELAPGVLPAAQYTFDPPGAYRAYALDAVALQAILATAPMELSAEAETSQVFLSLPLPSGGYETFRVEEAPFLSIELQQACPDIRDYKGLGATDPAATCRLSFSNGGFHAVVSHPTGDYEVALNQPTDLLHYISFRLSDSVTEDSGICGNEDLAETVAPTGIAFGTSLRELGLLVTVNNAFINSRLGATHNDKFAAATLTVHNVVEAANLFSERDLAVRFNLEDVIEFPNDQYINVASPEINSFLLEHHQDLLNARYPLGGHDLGHLFVLNSSGGAAGRAHVKGMCKTQWGMGASSAGGRPDAREFVRTVAHELGHQLGANHTFNIATGTCGPHRVDGSAFERDAGRTIMSYSGSCGTGDSAVEDRYHVHSIEEIHRYLTAANGGDSCVTSVVTNNAIPTVDAGADFTVPTGTAFRLPVTAHDADGDVLRFAWEQMDKGKADSTENAQTGVLFYVSSLMSSLQLPRFAHPFEHEVLPTESRLLRFRCTVRDSKGGVASDDVVVTVAGEPLRITYPNGGEEVPCGPWTVEWTGGGVAATVNVSIAFDGYNFVRLVTGTPNDGEADIVFPCNPTTTAILRVEAANGTFFDDSDGQWTLRTPTTILVPEEEISIEDALVSTKPGDVVQVTLEGTYTAHCEIPDGVTLRGAVDGVVISAPSVPYVVEFPDSCNKHTTLEHITVNAGTAGAILLRGSGTVRDCTIDGGSVGINGQGLMAASITGCTLEGQTADGIRLVTASNSPDRVVVQNNVLTGGSSATGIRVAQAVSGSDLGPDISRNTLDGWNVGIDVTVDTQPVVSYIRFNLVVGCSGYGVNCNANSWAEITHNCAWQNGVNYACNGGSNLTVDPLLCNTTEHGISRYALRVDSPISEENNEGGQIGARGVECACGVIERSSTLRSSETAVVLNDVTIPADRSLTVNGGATLLFDELDEGGGGADATRNELIVSGTLDIGDPGGELVTLMSASETPAPGDWAGITVNPGGHLYVDSADIRHATVGVRNSGPRPSSDIIALTNTRVRDFQTAAVYVVPTSQAMDGSAGLSVVGCLIEMGDDAPCGIYVADQNGYRAYAAYIGRTTITGSSAGMYGVYLAMRGPWPGEAEVDSVSVSGLTAGTGVYVAKHSPHLRGLIVSGCKWGAQLLGSGTPVLAPDEYLEMGSNFANCTTGLYVSADSVDVDSLSISSCTTGLSTYGLSSKGTYKDIDIVGCGIGLDARSLAHHTFREGSILDFTMQGVKALAASGLDLGTIAAPGGNNIYSSQPGVLKYVSVKNPIIGQYLMAQQNYWGEYPAPALMFSPAVTYTPELQQLSLLRRPVRMGVMAPGPMLAVNPNPFLGSVTVEFEVPAGASGLELSIFDVRGRLVRSWRDEGAGTGRYKQTWDGLDSRGTPVPVGLYFLQYRSGTTQRTTKVVRMVR